MITFIVEGWSDHEKIKSVYPQPEVDTVVLYGTKFDNNNKNKIELALSKGPTYLLTDPDTAGDWIAGVIQGVYDIPRIVADPSKCRFLRNLKGWKYGIEYCSRDYIKELLGGYIK